MTCRDWRAALGATLLCIGLPAHSMQVTVTASKTNPDVGESFYVTVSGVDLPKNGGASLGLIWNSAVVSVTGMELAPSSPFDYLASNAPSYSPFTFSVNEGNACDGGPCSFDAIRISFKVIGKGNASILVKDDGANFGWSNPDDPNLGMLKDMRYSQANVIVGAPSGETAAPVANGGNPPPGTVPASAHGPDTDSVMKSTGDRESVVNAVIFAVLAVAFMLAGRKLGSMLSDVVRYPAPTVVAMIFAVGWGILVALAIRELLNWQQPIAIVRWVMGYALGGYVAVPNYNLLKPLDFPEPAKGRNILSAGVSLISYISASALFAVTLTGD